MTLALRQSAALRHRDPLLGAWPREQLSLRNVHGGSACRSTYTPGTRGAAVAAAGATGSTGSRAPEAQPPSPRDAWPSPLPRQATAVRLLSDSCRSWAAEQARPQTAGSSAPSVA